MMFFDGVAHLAVVDRGGAVGLFVRTDRVVLAFAGLVHDKG